MKEAVTIDEVLLHLEDWRIIDVRSPGEFSDGHIPGAINIPLFDNEERAIVGTLYKQKSPEAAFREGLKIAGSKMVELVDAVKPFRNKPGKKILIHCWRGGKRSRAMEWLYSFSGIEIYRLEDGYKSFRGKAFALFENSPFTFNILGGYTGGGKTEILEALARKGEQVIDLEKLARHKGSAFGSIGEEEPPSTEQFENDLFLKLRSLDPKRPVWLENESKSIGKVYIPEGIWRDMRDSVLYTIDVDKQIRLDRALRYYCEPIDVDQLKNSFARIKKRLGGLNYQLAIKALEQHDLRTAADIALTYYDKSYIFQLNHWPKERVVHLQDCNDVEQTANRLLQLNNRLINN
ncbi:MAG TPA: tRNA 2-selenouridine(34) synthase MnmH [Saprospiraceae bacterium]